MNTAGSMEPSVEKAQKVAPLGVHIADDGSLWFADGDHHAVRYSHDYERFANTLVYKRAKVVRVVGMRANVGMLVHFHNLHAASGSGPQLEVGSPLICGNPADRHDPQVLLVRGRGCRLSASLGGWHKFTDLDYPSYAIAAQLQDGKVTPECLARLREHPAWRALMFVRANEEACVRLIAEVLDPRWYVDTDHPERSSRLESYLGLTMRTMTTVMAGGKKRPSKGHMRDMFDRCRAVREAWSAGPAGHIEDPRSFLFRIQQSKPGTPGTLRASSVFVRYFRQTWLDGLYNDRQCRLFIPEHFFKRPAEANAYRDWQPQ